VNELCGGSEEKKLLGDRCRREAHAEAEAGDKGEGAATPDGNHCDVKGPVFRTDL
jgi:hypothetical protein